MLCLCRFSRLSLLLEPGLVVLAFGVLIAALVAFARLDLSLAGSSGGSSGGSGGSSGGSKAGGGVQASPKELYSQICSILSGVRPHVLRSHVSGASGAAA